MKKILSILLATVLLLSLAACNSNSTTDGTTPNEKTPAGTTGDKVPAGSDAATEPQQAEESFALTFNNVKLVPGAPFDAAALPEAESVMEVPSCAFEGTDNAYNYGVFELTAYDEGNGEVIYSIYMLDPNMSTDEGLYLGDDLGRAEELYGTNYQTEGTQITYAKGNTQLILILQDNSIISIEYRMAQ